MTIALTGFVEVDSEFQSPVQPLRFLIGGAPPDHLQALHQCFGESPPGHGLGLFEQGRGKVCGNPADRHARTIYRPAGDVNIMVCM